MTFNFSLFWRMSVCSFFRTAHTHGALTRKRLIFLLLFYTFWPAMVAFTWACFLLDDLFFPAYRKQPVEKPLFILGNFRSGSTFLHRLLTRDASTFTSLRTWDIFMMPSITQRRLYHGLARLDARLGGLALKMVKCFDARFLGHVQIHKIALFEPEEDEMILMYAWSSFFVGILFPFLDEVPPYQFFDAAIPRPERLRIMEFYRACLQRHLYATGGGRYFVAKNPAFSPKIETLLEIFPDARIVYLVRNPLDTLPSTLSWLSYAWHVCSDPREEHPYRDEILALTHYWYDHPLKVLDQQPSPRHVILNFEDLIRCPDLIIRDLYARLGYPRSRDQEQILRAAAAETRTHHSAHVYDLEEMGFTREQIVREFTGIFARFNFDQREGISVEASEGAAEDQPLRPT